MERDGDVVGKPIEGGIYASLNQCASKCTEWPECKSFEHNEKMTCNLNKERDPDGPKQPGFIFCSKKGIIKVFWVYLYLY